MRRTPADSSGSAVSRRPAVSVRRTGQPSSATSAVTASRVVPGVGETIARPNPVKAFSRELLPTLGGPNSTTAHGRVRCRPNAAHPSIAAAARGSPAAAASPRASVPDA